LPKIRENWRIHRDSKINAAAPDRKNSAGTAVFAGSRRSLMGVVASAMGNVPPARPGGKECRDRFDGAWSAAVFLLL